MTQPQNVKQGWHQAQNGNWLYFCEGTLEGTVFQTDSGQWCGVHEGSYLPDRYDDLGDALEAYIEAFA